jgi:CheY-like chemotaxis protein
VAGLRVARDAPQSPAAAPRDVSVLVQLSSDTGQTFTLYLSLPNDVADRLMRRQFERFMGEMPAILDDRTRAHFTASALTELAGGISSQVAGIAGRTTSRQFATGVPQFRQGPPPDQARLGQVRLETDCGLIEIGMLRGVSASPATPNAARAAGATALIADDSVLIRMQLSKLLREQGLTVVAEASNGSEALDLYRRHRPDVVFLDINMDIADGMEILPVIRAEDPGVRVVMCSSIVQEHIVQACMAEGATEYLVKPFSLETVQRVVAAILPNRKDVPRRSPTLADPVLQNGKIHGYVIRRLAGRGGMANVYWAWDPTLRRTVAIKVLNARIAREKGAVGRFLEEARSMARINHPNVVQIYHLGSDRRLHYFVMEFLSGGDLQRRVAQRGPLPIPEALDIIEAAACGLAAAAKRDVVHDDVKPENLLFNAEGQLKVTDFGIAKVRTQIPDDAASEMFEGTPEYAAPEKVYGHPSDLRTDIYALGMTLYFMLAGDVPFTSTKIDDILRKQVTMPRPSVPHRPDWINDLIARMTALHAAQRFQTYEELLSHLDALRQEHKIDISRPVRSS